MLPTENRGGGMVRFIAEAEGYVMVRWPGVGMPFVLSAKEWAACTPVAIHGR